MNKELKEVVQSKEGKTVLRKVGLFFAKLFSKKTKTKKDDEFVEFLEDTQKASDENGL